MTHPPLRRHAAALCTLCTLAAPALARAEVERFALIVGNNRGDPHEQALRYAESDAQRVRDVLRELGGFEPQNTVLLQGEDAETLQTTLIALNSRIRARMTSPAIKTVLVVYYSGHADAIGLHLSGSRFALQKLRDLVQGSAASFRIAVLDACRSGALTRHKGGKRVPPFALLAEPAEFHGEGVAFLTASASDEDAQESDAIGGSFFTHALVSGLLGAADNNADGEVVLDEAYRYAYEATLRETSRTFAGTQHPTYRYDFRGQGDIVLTRPGLRDARRGHLQLPAGVSTLLLRGDADGPVVAEVEKDSPRHRLSLRPGRYFVRARGQDAVYEGTVDLAAGRSTALSLSELQAIRYARLVRKGGGERSLAHAVELGTALRSALRNAESVCLGLFVGYGVDTPSLGLRGRLDACTAQTEGERIDTRVWGYGLSLRLYRAWDLGPLSLELGLGPGLTFFVQRFDTAGKAEDRSALAPYLTVGGGASLGLGGGFYLGLDVSAETYLLTLDDGNAGERRRTVDLSVRPALLAGKRF